MFRFSPLFLDLQNLRSRTNRAGPTQNSTTAEATGHTAPARGLWQMTFGAVNSGAGRIFATILSGPNVFSGFFFLTHNKKLAENNPPFAKWFKTIFLLRKSFFNKKSSKRLMPWMPWSIIFPPSFWSRAFRWRSFFRMSITCQLHWEKTLDLVLIKAILFSSRSPKTYWKDTTQKTLLKIVSNIEKLISIRCIWNGWCPVEMSLPVGKLVCIEHQLPFDQRSPT